VVASYRHVLPIPLIDDVGFDLRVSASMLVER
jgi:hypothetical protein